MSENTTAGTEQVEAKVAEAPPAETGEATEQQKPEPTIPKARLDAEISKRKELEAALTKYREAEQKAADDEQKRQGLVEQAQAERDQLKTEAEQWRKYASEKLDELMDGMPDEDKAVLAELGEEAPLNKRLAVAERLAARGKPEEPGFGTKGGKGETPAAGLIPHGISSMAEYHTWLANLRTSPDGMALLRDSEKMAAVRDEARKKFQR